MTALNLTLVQVMVDLTLPAAVVEDVAAAVDACLAAQPGEFSGASIVAFDERGGAADFNKATLRVSFSLTHAGAHLELMQPHVS